MRWSVWSLDTESRAIHRDEIPARTPVEATEAVVWPGHLVIAVFPAGVSDELGLSRALHRSMARDATRGAA